MRIAFIQDALPFLGGAERVLEASLELFPAASLYTLVYNREKFSSSPIGQRPVETSFINRLPGKSDHYRSYLPLFPFAVERFDLRRYDLVLSFSYAVAHGVLTSPDQYHMCYMHRPLRQAWQGYPEFMEQFRHRRRPLSLVAGGLMHYMRMWDSAAARRVDTILAVSTWIAGMIRRVYHRPARVIYPPVDVDRFDPAHRREDYFITVSRLEASKRVDLLVEAFNRLDLPLLVIGEGREYERLVEQAGPNVKLLGWQPDEKVQELLNRARAYVCASVEDFGIAAVEAQAAGCPVIAYGKGGVLETVVHGQTGLIYPQQSAQCLIFAVEDFIRQGYHFDPGFIQQHAQRFSRQRFQVEFGDAVACNLEAFRRKNNFDRGMR